MREKLNTKAFVSIILSALVISTLFVSVGYANHGGDGILWEDWEDGSSDGWSVDGNMLTNDPYHENYHFQIDPDTYSDNRGSNTFTSDSYHTIGFAVKPNSWDTDSSNSWPKFMAKSYSNGRPIEIQIEQGNIYTIDSGGSQVSTGISINLDNWYEIWFTNIDYTNDQFDIEVYNRNGELIGSSSNHAMKTDISDLNGFQFEGYYGAKFSIDYIRANPTETLNSPTSTVSGTVSDGSGNPVSSADIQIENSTNGDIVFTGTTDTNGEYSTDLADGDYTVTASKEKYHSDSSMFTVSGSAVTQNLTIETQEIRGTIQDSNGNLISGSDIIVKDKATGNIVLNETGASTTYEVTVSDGDYWVNVTHPDYKKNETSVSLTSDENTDEFHDVILRMENEVTGKITNSNGDPLQSATVNVSNSNITKETTTDADGVYSFYLKSGDYTINVTKTTYKPYESQISINSSTQLNTIELESKEYNLNLRVSPYMNHSDTQKYVIRFNDDIITENATISASNTSLISINTTMQTLNATNTINDTGEVNITATYQIDGKTITDSQNVTVAPMTIEYVEILSPLYGTLALVSDETIQYLILVIIAGVGVTTMVNAFGGISLMIMSLIIGWIIDYIPEGVLLASLFGGIFIMMNTQLREYRTR